LGLNPDDRFLKVSCCETGIACCDSCFRPFPTPQLPAIVRACGKLRGRDNKIKQWSEYRDFQSIADAAQRILELEADPNGALFLRVYVDPNPLTGQTADAAILSRLEYQSGKGFCLLERRVR
jgi:hypothetical protein